MINGTPSLNGLPEGCKAFGTAATDANILKWAHKWKDFSNDLNAFLIIAESRTAEIKGISAAGSTPLSRRYTAIADAEFLLYGSSVKRLWPLPPLNAGVSPALISRVSSQIIGVEPIVIAVGLSHTPNFQHVQIEIPCLGPANCLSTGKAMSYERVENLWNKGLSLGLNMKKPLLLSECVPGGTTTAQAVLTGLGLQVSDLISGSSKVLPVGIKKKIVDCGLEIACLGEAPCPKELLAAIGDPFQALAVGVLLGARRVGQEVLLGGGCQMLAILALALSALHPSEHKIFVEGISIATTNWLLDESSDQIRSKSSFICLIDLVSNHFKVPIMGVSTGLSFAGSSFKKLMDYEDGHIKEGVGAGAFALLAQLKGFSIRELVVSCEDELEDMERTRDL